jgi:V/A-type H+-transporting ATPase subunit I
MSIVKMKFINIVGPKNQFDKFVREHIVNNSIQLENAIGMLGNVKGLYPYIEENPYESLMKKASEVHNKMRLPYLHIPQVVCDYTIEQMDSYFKSVSDRLSAILNKKEEIMEVIENSRQIIKSLLPMKDVDVQLQRLFNLDFIKFRFGKLPTDSYKKLKMYLEDMEVFYISVAHERDYEWMIYFVPAYFEEKIDSIFTSLYFERSRISDKVSGLPVQALDMLKQEIKGYELELERIQNELSSFIEEEREEFLRVYYSLRYINDSFNIRKYSAHTDESFYITGWISENAIKAFSNALDKEGSISYIIEEPEMVKRSRAPTELKNIGIFKPFEALVRVYGLPSYNEIDPTVFVAITYLVLFGMMFGDVGQGAVLGILGWYLFSIKGLNLGGVIISAGLSSMLFGWFYGSVFGYEDWIKPLILSPIHNINIMLGIAVLLGVLLISTAMLINIINGIKSKDIARVMFDKNGVAGLIFYWSVLIFLFYFISKGQFIVPGIVIALLLILPLFCIAFKEPLEGIIHKRKNILPEDKGSFFAEVFFEMFDTILGFVSNTVSFVRVSAFALNHVGLFMAVFILAKMTSGLGNIAVVVVGNIMVIALEGMIVGIQDLRLVYYELFSRFFSGAGRAFSPIIALREKS